MSRQGYPKQLLALLNDHSLLQNTVLRLNGLTALQHPFWFVTKHIATSFNRKWLRLVIPMFA